MKTIDALSTPFYAFDANENLVEDVKKLVEKVKFNPGESDTMPDFSNSFYYEPLVNWFEECLEQVRDLYFIDTIKLEVTNCWVTRTSKLKKHHPHMHQQSLVSGIFYLDDFASGETIFYEKNPWNFYQHNKIMYLTDISKMASHQLVTKILPKKGKLILYPSQIMHATSTNKDSKIRYTVAFDSFFSGRIFVNSRWPYFEIKSTNIRNSSKS